VDDYKHRRRRKVIDWFVIVALPATLVGAVVWNDHTNDASRDASRMQACRARNTAQEFGRRNDEIQLNGFLEVFPESEEALRYVDEVVRPKLYTAAEMDTDCNTNGELDEDDYEPGMPPHR
jgi:hypothetical protein